MIQKQISLYVSNVKENSIEAFISETTGSISSNEYWNSPNILHKKKGVRNVVLKIYIIYLQIEQQKLSLL